jgi:hypothetical protein
MEVVFDLTPYQKNYQAAPHSPMQEFSALHAGFSVLGS